MPFRAGRRRKCETVGRTQIQAGLIPYEHGAIKVERCCPNYQAEEPLASHIDYEWCNILTIQCSLKLPAIPNGPAFLDPSAIKQPFIRIFCTGRGKQYNNTYCSGWTCIHTSSCWECMCLWNKQTKKC